MYMNFCPTRKKKCKLLVAKIVMKLMFMFMMKTGMLTLVAACLSCCSGRGADSDGELKCRVMKVEGGYGYVVLHGGDTLICQPYMPAVRGRRPFSTKKDALNTGRLVCRRLAEGQSPALSGEDVKSCLTDTGVCRDKGQCLSR